jgi:RNase P subunit RPR2
VVLSACGKGGGVVERKWRCKECDTLLGVEHGDHMHLRYKQAQYVVDGGDYNVMAVCRNCSTINERNGGRQQS